MSSFSSSDPGSPYSFRVAATTPAAYRALATLLRYIYPDRSWAPEQLRAADDAQRQAGFFQRHEARAHGRLVGSGTLFALATSRSGTLYFGFVVKLGYEESTLPAALQAYLFHRLADQKPDVIMTRVQETVTYRIRLLEADGFVPVQRTIPSELDVSTFAAASFAGAVERLRAQEICVQPVADWLVGTPDWQGRLWQLMQLVEPEVSLPQRRRPASYEEFLALLNATDMDPAAWGVAVDRRGGGNRPVGVTIAAPLPSRPDVLAAGLTGVHPDYRRRGIALALKLQTIAYARRCAYQRVRTENSAGHPLLVLNRQLGFQPEPALVDYALEAATGTEERLP